MTQDIGEQITWLKNAIAQLESELVLVETEVEELRYEIAIFEVDYNRRIQPIIQRIEAVKNAISDIEALRKQQSNRSDHSLESLWRAAAGRTPPPPPDKDFPPISPPISQAVHDDNERIKQLYHQLARRYHPDLAKDEEDRQRRNEMMLIINEAYAKRDFQALKRLDKETKTATLSGSSTTTSYQKVTLRILRERYHQLAEQVDNLKIERASLLQSDMMDLKLKSSLARARGRDLLAELAQELEEEYWDWVRKLDALRDT